MCANPVAGARSVRGALCGISISYTSYIKKYKTAQGTRQTNDVLLLIREAFLGTQVVRSDYASPGGLTVTIEEDLEPPLRMYAEVRKRRTDSQCPIRRPDGPSSCCLSMGLNGSHKTRLFAAGARERNAMTIDTSCMMTSFTRCPMSSPMMTAICVDNSQEPHCHRTDGNTAMCVPSPSAHTMAYWEIQYPAGS